MNLKVIDSNIEPIPGNPHMLRIGIIGKGLKRYWIMMCITGPQKGIYIEEYVDTSVDFGKDTFGHFAFIYDDNLAFDLSRFAQEKGLLDVVERFGQAQAEGKLHLLFKE